MKTVLITKLTHDFLIKGLNLAVNENGDYQGKVGRQEIILLAGTEFLTGNSDVQIIFTGSAASGKFRPGDVLMAGNDDLLDRAFQALDELDKRGVVVNLVQPAGAGQISLSEVGLENQVQAWKEQKIPFLCLLLVEPVNSEEEANLVTLVRKIIN